jgi:hypothetical protein
VNLIYWGQYLSVTSLLLHFDNMPHAVNRLTPMSHTVHWSLLYSTARTSARKYFWNNCGLRAILLSSAARRYKEIGAQITGYWGMVMWTSHWRTAKPGKQKHLQLLDFFARMAQRIRVPKSGSLKCVKWLLSCMYYNWLHLGCFQDWPPSQNFEKMFPELYMALNKSAPVPQLMCLNGSLNMAVHYPTNGIAPDAGESACPQLHNAYFAVVPRAKDVSGSVQHTWES